MSVFKNQEMSMKKATTLSLIAIFFTAYQSITQAAPGGHKATVTIAVLDSSTSEVGPKAGVFSVTRPG